MTAIAQATNKIATDSTSVAKGIKTIEELKKLASFWSLPNPLMDLAEKKYPR